MDDGHENRRNKGTSYGSNDHDIKTVVFIKGPHHLRAAPETKLRVNNSISDLYYKNVFFLQIQLPKYVLINFDGYGEKNILAKRHFSESKSKNWESMSILFSKEEKSR